MPLPSKHDSLDRFEDRLHNAAVVNADLFAGILTTSCHRLAAMRHSKQARKLEQLLNAGAWTDAALALIELELPQWQVRRIAYDEGRWYCGLSRQRELPEWLDQSIETHHANLALAILGAYNAAFHQLEAPKEQSTPLGMQMPATAYEPLCCENFA